MDGVDYCVGKHLIVDLPSIETIVRQFYEVLPQSVRVRQPKEVVGNHRRLLLLFKVLGVGFALD